MMKNSFYFRLLFLLNFCTDLFDHVQKRLDRKLMLRSKCMRSQSRLPAITIHILSNISRRKVNQRMTFGQFIEYNITNIFLEKSYTKRDGEASSRPFYKKTKLSISLDRLSEFWSICFYSISKSRSTKIY